MMDRKRRWYRTKAFPYHINLEDIINSFISLYYSFGVKGVFQQSTYIRGNLSCFEHSAYWPTTFLPNCFASCIADAATSSTFFVASLKSSGHR